MGIKKHKKPTGTTGVNYLGDLGPNTLSAFEPAALTGSKSDNEMKVVTSFLKTAEHVGLKSQTPIVPVQNSEADYDFTLPTSGGEIVLELLELAPSEQMKAGYTSASATHNVLDFCDSIFGQIAEKSTRYARPKKKRFDLLVYVIHWAFMPSQTCIELLQYWCVTKPHVFDDIYLHLYAGAQGVSFVLFPAPHATLATFDPASVRGKKFTNLNPFDWKTGKGDMPRVGPIPPDVPGIFMMGAQIEEGRLPDGH
ncbi:MAG: hypothetical protein ABSG50_11365 [Opitutaceae bacterium]|jgi:hypothetical protein